MARFLQACLRPAYMLLVGVDVLLFAYICSAGAAALGVPEPAAEILIWCGVALIAHTLWIHATRDTFRPVAELKAEYREELHARDPLQVLLFGLPYIGIVFATYGTFLVALLTALPLLRAAVLLHFGLMWVQRTLRNRYAPARAGR